MSGSDAPPIEIDGLTKYYGDVRGVEDLTFSVASGEIFGFLGPNGAGKSTAIRVLLGLLKPTDGAATLLGRDVTDRAALREAKRELGYLPSDVRFYDRVTGAEVLDYFGRLRGEGRRSELLERFPVPLDRPVRAYSSGNRQKLAIVATFMHDPELAIMDEPTAGLDPLVQNEFYELLDERKRQGQTSFFSSHVLSEVRRVCDRVGIIRRGRLIELDTVENILAAGGTVVTARLAEDPPPEDLEFPGTSSVERRDGEYSLVLAREFDALIDRLHEYTVLDLEVRDASIDDVFMHFYGDDAEPEEESDT
ncbi:ABC-2 type transport system ATP-binding protein [Natronoarchaeum philippinense]|uniref:ABC-2 type transport system ATP-binding protein n=1 Tax=Natronoarchaeum philippinense TaxID=558529 RepID=A0A285NUM5_NATPI|nr:ABC transporter ATP-binding protein [Natronoarchaeum philippinense]SNZ12623.1 ABC-2 type transport system ATP-binding protein [Natronoarchaeum philippinense]